jgi:HlyD family secretion protein
MSRKTKRVALVVLVLAAVGIGAGAYFARKEKAAVVQTALVERVPALKSLVTASGSIQAEESVDIQAEIPGVIIELLVREGERVTLGQVLLRIDPVQTKAELMAAEAQALAAQADAKSQEVEISSAEVQIAGADASKKSIEADLVQAQAALEDAERLERRKRGLHEQQLIPAEEYAAAQTTQRAAQAQVDSARARIAQYEAQVKTAHLAIEQYRARHEAAQSRAQAARVARDQAEDLLGKTTIYSPLDGIITALNVEKGERAVPGIQSNPEATLMTIADLSLIQAELLVDETDIVQIRLNQSVEVEVDALPETKLAARVVEIGNAPVQAMQGQSQEGKDFLVKAVIESPPESLRPGMSCEAEVLTATRENALVIPLQSLTVREVDVDERGEYVPPTPGGGTAANMPAQPASEQGGSAPVVRATGAKKELQGVFLRGADDRVQFRPVKTGIDGEMDCEVLNGLEGGEEVLIGPYKLLRTISEGSLVKVDNASFKRFRRAGEQPEE